MSQIEKWQPAQVAQWLQQAGLGEHAPAFLRSEVDGALLLHLDQDMLAELGMRTALDRKKFVLRLQQTKEDAAMQFSMIHGGGGVHAQRPPAAPAAVDGGYQTLDDVQEEMRRGAPAPRNPSAAQQESPYQDLEEFQQAYHHQQQQQQQHQPHMPAQAHRSHGHYQELPAFQQQPQPHQLSQSPSQQARPLPGGLSQQAYDEAVTQLTAMFAGLGRADVEAALYQHDGAMDATLDALLTMNSAAQPETREQTPPSQPSRHQAASPYDADLALAMRLEREEREAEHARRASQQQQLADDQRFANQLFQREAVVPPPAMAHAPRSVVRPPVSFNFGDTVEEDRGAEWLHGDISRDQAEALMTAFGLFDGLFLLRRSTSMPGAYVLSVAERGGIVHHIIYAGVNMYELFGIPFKSLTQLVAFFSQPHPEVDWASPLMQHVPCATAAANAATSRRARRTKSMHSAKSRSSAGGSGTSRFSFRHRHSQAGAEPDFSNPAYGQDRGGGAGPGGAQPAGTSPPPLPTSLRPSHRSGSIHLPSRAHFVQTVASPQQQQQQQQYQQQQLSGEHALRMEDFDLDGQAAPASTYAGDRYFRVALGEVPEPALQAARAGGLEGQECVLRTCEATVDVLLEEESVEALFQVPLLGVDEAESQDSSLRLVVSDGVPGVFYLSTPEAAAIAQTIVGNRNSLRAQEDYRMAQLMQNEEFIAHLRHDPEFAALVEEERRILRAERRAERRASGLIEEMDEEEEEAREREAAAEGARAARAGEGEDVREQLQNIKSDKGRRLLAKLARKFQRKGRVNMAADDGAAAAAAEEAVRAPAPAATAAATAQVSQMTPPPAWTVERQSPATFLEEPAPVAGGQPAHSPPTPDDFHIISSNDVLTPPLTEESEEQEDGSWVLPGGSGSPVRPTAAAAAAAAGKTGGERSNSGDPESWEIIPQSAMFVRTLVRRVPNVYDSTALAYNAGDIIRVTRRLPTGIWEGTLNGQAGHFPMTEVEEIVGVSESDLQLDDILLEDFGAPPQPPAEDEPAWAPGQIVN